MTEVLLQTKALTKKYGDFAALSDVSLSLRQGDIYGLVGRNGAGKTTFFKCVMGLAKASAGEISIGAQGGVQGGVQGSAQSEANAATGRHGSLNAERRKIGFMISASFFPYLNPRQNLEYLCRVKGISRKGESDRLLEIVGLSGVKKPFKSFSLGMKQRLGIAGALLGSPSIVVLDEPINGLDPQGIADIRSIIREFNRDFGITFIVSSHILSELDLVASTFGFIEQGRLVQEISHADLHEHTKKSLIIEVDNADRAAAVLREKLGIAELTISAERLALESHLDQSNIIARTLVEAGLELFRISPQETTLEEYFMRLIGGEKNA